MAARSPARKIGYLLERVTETHILAVILVILVFLYAREHMLRFAFDSVILFPLLAARAVGSRRGVRSCITTF